MLLVEKLAGKHAGRATRRREDDWLRSRARAMRAKAADDIEVVKAWVSGEG